MTKTFIRVFTIVDYEEEEAWLREQANRGWRLLKMVPPCFYTFEQCQQEDVIYRLEFKNEVAETEYKQLYADFGWEYCATCMGWHYFRRPAEEAAREEETEIFSDSSSKVGMIQKIIQYRMLPLLVIFLCCVIPNYFRSIDGELGTVFTAFWIVMFLFYVSMLSYTTVKVTKLKKKYSL